MGGVSTKSDHSSSSSSSSSGSYRRRAHYSGSWYDADPNALNETLSAFLSNAVTTPTTPTTAAATTPPSTNRLRALISPHAGYSYSGPTAAYAYQALHKELGDPHSPIQSILVLHPSHHVHLLTCAVSAATHLETPLGPLTVNDALRQEILQLGSNFTVMTQAVDEEEHSGELQYPYLAKICQDCHKKQVSVLPVMCGALSCASEQAVGRQLAAIVARPEILTVVSTDFCHWGSRFSYQPTPPAPAPGRNVVPKATPLHEFIRTMDRRGMDLIELQRPGAFSDYLKETKNTVCGRHAVAVWMRAVEAATGGANLQVTFVRYAQSSAATAMSDSSVSYAAAVATSL